MLLHMKLSQSNAQATELRVNPSWRVGIVHANFYAEDMQEMLGYAVSTLVENGIESASITTHAVSGSFEIPLIGAALAKQQRVDALIGLGIIVEGETEHARLVAENTVRGMMDIQTMHALPFVCEVLYVPTLNVAKERLSKGKDAALCVLHSLAQLEALQS